MRMVRCYACGKRYDYDEDGFCPGCGAFNQPERTSGPQELPRQKAPADRAAGPEAAKKLPKRRSGEKSGLHAGVEAGLDIALIHKYYDLAKLGDALAADHYHHLERKASDCVHCGHCTKRCPFGADPMKEMETISAYFGE